MSLAAVIFVSLVTATVAQSSTADPAQQQPAAPAQAQADSKSASTLPVSLDRIRKALDEAPTPAADAPKLKIDTSNVPVFRTQTEGTTIKLANALDDGTNVGAYVHPQYGPYDYEFKQMVTPDAVKGCGRLSQGECIQSFANQAATALLWNYATQKRKPAAPSVPPPPDPETQRIRAQIQQELLDQQAATAATPPSKP
jgi:hypothetical protein